MLLDAVLDCMKKEFAKPPPKWRILTKYSENDMLFLNNECKTKSEFDPKQMRLKMINGLQNGESYITVAQCAYGTIYAVYNTPEQYHDIPWNLWGRILRMYAEDLKPFKIFFLANDAERTFPNNEPITPVNINGGYTYHCNKETIMIYRAEDATRVLLHELMHACCLDKMENGIDSVESETEAWAELLYIGFLSQGNTKRFHELLHQQSAWIIEQNKKVHTYIQTPFQFPWRYTIGKEEVWKRWNILQNVPIVPMVGQSLRLTFPPNNYYKRAFNVRQSSTIL